MKNKIFIIIIILLVIIVGVLIFWILDIKKEAANKTAQTETPETMTPAQTPPEEENLSEQPNQDKFNEYFKKAELAKLPAGQKFDPFKIIKTKTFISTDQFCTSLEMKKTIPSGSFSTALYDTEKKEYVREKGVFPMELKKGGSVGCEELDLSAGKYEYKIYVDDVLAAVLPFEIQ